MNLHFAALVVCAAITPFANGDVSSGISRGGDVPWLVPTLDVRARHEFSEVDGLDASHALTVRERIGLKTCDWHGFSFLVEGEFVQSVIDDYNAGGGANPIDAANSPINDPRNHELNQAYVCYRGEENVVRIGRQRLVFDNTAFVGNVGWRQNEQTYDAFSLTNTSLDGFTLNFAYIDGVRRIFGVDAVGPFRQLDTDIILLNGTYDGFRGITLGAYAYLMRFRSEAPTLQSSGLNNDTLGIFAKGGIAGFDLHGEIAWQEKAGWLNNDHGLYAHFTATRGTSQGSLTVGIEHLDAGVQTPLATLHAYNGFADAFVTARLTGNATQVGLTDFYAGCTTPLFLGLKWSNSLHLFGDNSISTDLGYEFDSVLTKKFDDHFTGILKFAHFESECPLFPTTTRVSIELNCSF